MEISETLEGDRRGDDALIEEAILPTNLSQRPIGMLGYAWIYLWMRSQDM